MCDEVKGPLWPSELRGQVEDLRTVEDLAAGVNLAPEMMERFILQLVAHGYASKMVAILCPVTHGILARFDIPGEVPPVIDCPHCGSHRIEDVETEIHYHVDTDALYGDDGDDSTGK